MWLALLDVVFSRLSGFLIFSLSLLVCVGCAGSLDSLPLSDISRQNSEEEPEKSVELSLQEEIQRVTNVKASSKIK